MDNRVRVRKAGNGKERGERLKQKNTFVIVLKTRELGQIVTTAECSTISRHEKAVLPVAIGWEQE